MVMIRRMLYLAVDEFHEKVDCKSERLRLVCPKAKYLIIHSAQIQPSPTNSSLCSSPLTHSPTDDDDTPHGKPLFICPHVYICPSVYLSVCLRICLLVCLSVCVSVFLSVRLSTCLSVSLFVRLSVCLFVYLPVSPSVCLTVCVSVYMSVVRWIDPRYHPNGRLSLP